MCMLDSVLYKSILPIRIINISYCEFTVFKIMCIYTWTQIALNIYMMIFYMDKHLRQMDKFSEYYWVETFQKYRNIEDRFLEAIKESLRHYLVIVLFSQCETLKAYWHLRKTMLVNCHFNFHIYNLYFADVCI